MTPQQHYAFTEVFELVSEDGCSLAEAADLVTGQLAEVFEMDSGSAIFLAEQAVGLVAQELKATEVA